METTSSTAFENSFKEHAQFVDHLLRDYLTEISVGEGIAAAELKQSIEYSLLGKGKRFRPALCILMAEALGEDPSLILPFACAVEMIHTYSLVHDDLPCMDNDDFRRGEPTNHKVFGESVALLAGDALLTEAFTVLSRPGFLPADRSLALVRMLSKAAGVLGMIGGQALDMQAKKNIKSIDDLTAMQMMKTGALIRVCCEGVAVAAQKSEAEVELASRFGEDLGLAFQLADDLLDSKDEKLEPGSFPSLIGISATAEFLKKVSERAQGSLHSLGISKGPLHDLVTYNLNRVN